MSKPRKPSDKVKLNKIKQYVKTKKVTTKQPIIFSPFTKALLWLRELCNNNFLNKGE